jgi:hypothetical protein
VQGTARHGPVDPLDEVAVLRLGGRGVATLDGRRQALRQRLDRRAIAEVLERCCPAIRIRFFCCLMFAICVKRPAAAGPMMVPELRQSDGSPP